uniref:Dynein axonemal assembly factor 1 homolog n=1 Tax=Rhodnius prolixus TaxID=13249 RepID=T1HFN9_RHOPR
MEFHSEIELAEEEMKKKVLVDYESVPGVINFDLLRKALLQHCPEGKISKAVANESDFENCANIAIEYFNILRIDFLWVMPNLKVLSLANNLIEKIERLDTLVNLVELNLSFNKIEKIENLNKLVNLEVLNLYGNGISKIENLDELTKLTLLSVGGNNINNLECEIVSALLPQLVYYDYSFISEADRCIGRSLNLKMVQEIEEKELIEKELKDAFEEKEKRKEYQRRAMIEGFDDNEFFEFLMADDANYNAIRTVGEEAVFIFNDYQEKLSNFSKKICSIGEEYLVLREEEVENFEKGSNEREKICSDMVDQILCELRMKRREWKRELQDLFSIKSEEPVEALVDSLQRSQEVKFLFSDLIKQSWFKLMDLEMRRFEYAKETNTNFELELKEIINKQVEAFQNVFTDIRDTEKQFKQAIYEVMNRIVTDFHARRQHLGNLPQELKWIFAEPESLHNFIKVSYEQHLYLLECLEDKLMQLLLEWQEQKIGHLAKKENERNRDAVYRLNVFLDHQINYFDEMTKPLLKQCQKILSDGYVDKVQNKILSAVNQLQLK